MARPAGGPEAAAATADLRLIRGRLRLRGPPVPAVELRVAGGDQGGSYGTQPGAAYSSLPRRVIIPLLAAASRSLPAVASHAIGFAELRAGAHSPGFGACEENGTEMGMSSHQSVRCGRDLGLPHWPGCGRLTCVRACPGAWQVAKVTGAGSAHSRLRPLGPVGRRGDAPCRRE